MNSCVPWRVLTTAAAILFLVAARPASGTEHYAFVAQWGSAGSTPGQFAYPFGLAADKYCNVYVADAGNNRVQKFNSVGTLLTYWGTAGGGSGQFDFPEGMAVDPLGNVYVADTNNHRIQKFTASGAYLTAWGQHGSADGYFDYPTGVAADHYGYIFTAEPEVLSDTSNYRIQKFTNTGAFVSKWPGLSSPQDIAVDNAGNVFVIDVNTVVRYSIYGTHLGQWGSYGTGPGQFDYPVGLCVDESGNVYVADTGNHRIQKFTGAGTFVVQWGSFGTGPNQFRYPADVAVDDSGSVYVSDQLNQRIQKFRPAPKVLLVHGICGDAEGWDPFAQVLADSGFTVDRLQYGSPSYSLRPAHYVNTLAATLDTMGPGPIVVVAHSMGGLITRDYIRRQIASGRPNKVAQLVTLGTPHHGSDLLARLLGLGPAADGLLGSILGIPCQGSPYSRPALLDMVPGAAYLNRLNYGADGLLYDDPITHHGWNEHAAETALPANVYLAAIAGTGSACNSNVRRILWPAKDGGYHPNDFIVATGASLLSNTGTFRALDTALALDAPASHTNNVLTVPCDTAYYANSTLAERAAVILRTSPAASPQTASSIWSSAPASTLASVEDSLQMAPAIVDTIPAGQILDRTVTLPATSLTRFMLFSTNAHVSLLDPNGMEITVADTSAAVGITFFDAGDPGFEGFEIVDPLPGTWTMRIDASASAVGQRIAGIVQYESGSTVLLSVPSTPIYPGDVMRVRGQVADGGTLRTDVTWTCSIIQPNGSTASIALYDDGAHADSSAGDGIYGNTATPAGGVGYYALTAVATAPGIGPLASVAYCELADVQDLAVVTGDIQLSTNVPQAGDSLTVYATVHNNSSTAALGVVVEIRDLRFDAVLGTSTIDLAAQSAVTVQAPWVPSAPDSHQVQVRVSPYVLDETDYANNTASRTIVLGAPVSVDREAAATQLRFDLPHPNPMSQGVVFSFTVPHANVGALDVYDILGRHMYGWRWPNLLPGSHAVAWDGHGVSGQRLRPGVYLCRLKVGEERLQRKIILQR